MEIWNQPPKKKIDQRQLKEKDNNKEKIYNKSGNLYGLILFKKVIFIKFNINKHIGSIKDNKIGQMKCQIYIINILF